MTHGVDSDCNCTCCIELQSLEKMSDLERSERFERVRDAINRAIIDSGETHMMIIVDALTNSIVQNAIARHNANTNMMGRLLEYITSRCVSWHVKLTMAYQIIMSLRPNTTVDELLDVCKIIKKITNDPEIAKNIKKNGLKNIINFNNIEALNKDPI